MNGEHALEVLKAHARSKLWLFLLYLVAVALFAQTRWQFEFILLLTVSLLTMALIGHRLIAWLGVLPRSGVPLVFFSALLGQFILVVVWLLCSPLTYAWTRGLGLPLAMPLLVVSVATVAAWGLLRKPQGVACGASETTSVLAWVPVVLGGLVCLKLASYYSMRAGSLGLDTHQHIAFSLDLFRAGYPKLSAGNTDWLEKYPKMLHLLTSLWAWPALGHHMGPFLKVQPVLQATLALFALLELMCCSLRRSLVDQRLQVAFAAVLSLLWCYVMVRGTAYLYPVVDLNSTGRLAGFGVLLAPTLCALLCWLTPARATQLLAWTLFAFAGAMAAKLNPSLVIGYASYAAPLFAVVMLLPWWRTGTIGGRLGWPLLGMLAGSLLGGLLLACDPYYLQLLAEVSPAVHHFVEHTLGLRVLETSHDISSASGGVTRLWEVLRWELWYGPQPTLWDQWLPATAQIFSSKLLWVTRAAAVLSLLLSLAFMVLIPFKSRQRSGFVLIFVLQLGALLAVLVALRSSNVISLVLGHETLQASLLSTYTQRYVDLIAMYSVPIHWLLLSAAAALGWDTLRSLRPAALPAVGTQRWSTWGLLLILLVCAIAIRRIDVRGPPPKSMGWTLPVTEKKVRQFRAAEARLPEDAVVLAPAYSKVLNGREDWVLPAGEIASYLPFGSRDYLFNVRLGSGYALQARDLDAAFCHASRADARALLRRHGITHIVATRGSAGAPLFDREYCSLSYRDLGIWGSEVSEGPDNIVFYRILP
ncbi:hypothetical protein [Stenotrophomonas rhizophila]|uniref:hypothetical protein n=1 Tax=Stenotrophomonas rhizophila TaxID=216778 RepID=UPI001E36AF7D|nr:hypothetical protein [Stenotrophomonas rhizophila]MCC7634089.1 hypothetical protein [Stenotrophomonas rhizophila]MCC7662785.1 hypothetical protein [Stenotrophomonas rhizophila]